MAETSKRILLTVSVGSADLAAYKRSIGAVEAVLRQNFPEFDHYSAFLSERICSLLENRDGVKVNNLTDILRKLSDETPQDILLLPILLTAGQEYRSILETAANFPQLSITVLPPLLQRQDDLFSLQKILTQQADSFSRDDALFLFVAHGGERELFYTLQRQLFDSGRNNILIGTLKGTPSFYETLRYARTSPYEKIILLPLLLTAGRHAARDIFGEENSWKTGLLAAGFSVECMKKGLCEYESVQQLFCEKLREATR